MAIQTDILQWNLRGLRKNYPELNLLIGTLNPNVLCLQETKLPTDENVFEIRNFSGYHHIHSSGEIACGGTSIFIKSSKIHQKIPLTSPLQAVAVRVTLHKPVTICSVYIPPLYKPSLAQFHRLVEQLPRPFFLVGDFNAHNPLWGSTRMDRQGKGKIIEDLLTQTDMCFLNDGSPTYMCPATLKVSCIDLTLCDPTTRSDFTWSVLEDPHGSDHFPIIIKPNVLSPLLTIFMIF